MQKIFLILAMLLLIPITSNAQIDQGLKTYYLQQGEKIVTNIQEDQLSFDQLVSNMLDNKFKVDVSGILKYLISLIFKESYFMLTILLKLLIPVILISIINTFASNIENNMVTKVGFIVGYIIVSGIIFKMFYQNATSVLETVKNTTSFMLQLMPIVFGVIMMGGKLSAPVMLQPVLFASVNIFSVIISSFVVPFTIFMSVLTICKNISYDLNLKPLMELIYKCIKWVMILLMTLFSGVIAIQGYLSGSLDALTMKTAKFVVGSSVPIVGSALSETVEVILSSGKVIKDVLGASGILFIVFITLIPILKLALASLSMKLLSALSAPFASKEFSDFFEDISSCFTLLLMIMICSSVLMITALSIVVLTSYRI